MLITICTVRVCYDTEFTVFSSTSVLMIGGFDGEESSGNVSVHTLDPFSLVNEFRFANKLILLYGC